MNTLPNTDDIATLGMRLDNDGFAPHEKAVAMVAEVARHTYELRIPAEILIDADDSDVARFRAFALIARRWPQAREQALAHRADFDRSFDTLLATWLEHENLRAASGSTAQLAASRRVLDDRRLTTARHRRRLSGSRSASTAA